MVLIDNGLNRVRDLLAADITKGQAGTNNTTPSETDTGLFAPISATNSVIDIATADRLINVSHLIGSLIANGQNLKEHEFRVNNNTVSFDRVVTATIPKDNTIEVTYIRSYFIDRA